MSNKILTSTIQREIVSNRFRHTCQDDKVSKSLIKFNQYFDCRGSQYLHSEINAYPSNKGSNIFKQDSDKYGFWRNSIRYFLSDLAR